MENIIEEILTKITPEEKAGLVCGYSFFGIAGIESLGIKDFQVLDGGTGINYEQLFGDICSKSNLAGRKKALSEGMSLINVIKYYYNPEYLSNEEKELRAVIKKEINDRLLKNTTNKGYTAGIFYNEYGDETDLMSPGCFPSGMLLGATWNRDVLYETGRALGREARAYGVHMLLGTPNINIHRDPLNGRLFEGLSEDPALVSALAPFEIKGVQDEGVAADVKHFAANNQETNRQGINEVISERALHEIYFPGFKACVKEGKPASVMSAYNSINGIPCTENRYMLTELLRDSWGFDGMVVSDWGAVIDQINALKAGNDVTMPGPVDIGDIMAALDKGELSMDELDVSAGRVIKLLLDYGNPGRYENSCQYIMDKSKQAAYHAACEGIVMLKNERGIFPVKTVYGQAENADSAFNVSHSDYLNLPKVYVCGSGAVSFHDCGVGSAGINTDRTTHFAECLMENGIDVTIGTPDKNIYRAENGRDMICLCVVRVNGMEGNDRENMNLSQEDALLLDRLVNMKRQFPRTKLGVILNVCGPVNLMPWIGDTDGLFCVFLPGMEGARAMADIIAGKVNPSGKLPITFPKQYADTPTCINFPGDGYQVNYGEGIYVGYRYYDKVGREPLFPFGFGLSYTRFKIDNLRTDTPYSMVTAVDKKGGVSSLRLPVVKDTIKISVDIENTGKMDGSEVLQLYMGDVESVLSKPVKELKDFKKVRLAGREKVSVDFTLSRDDFASYDSDWHEWTVEEGIYRIMIGTGSRNIVCSMDIYMDTESPYSYGACSSIKSIYENSVTKEMLYQLWRDLGQDLGSIESSYQYVPNTQLKDFFEDNLADVSDRRKADERIAEFYTDAGKIKKR